MLLEIRSMRVEKHVRKTKDKMIDEIQYVFNCKSNDKNYELVIEDNSSNEESTNQIFLKRVKVFSGISFVTKEKILIEYEPNQKEYDNCLFKFDEDGIQIKYDYLVPTNRIQKKRPVWIMVGQSALGKSYLSSMLVNGSELTKYETDVSPTLPEEISEDMIIVGNKYKFSLKDIRDRIYGEYEAIVVDFKKDE